MEYHKKLLWYSSLSTGIFEVDNQHANIDMLLRFLSDKGCADSDLINEITNALESHFEYEESLVGDNFPKDHKEEHERFKKFLAFNTAELLENRLSLELFIGTVESALIEHASCFDSQLTRFI